MTEVVKSDKEYLMDYTSRLSGTVSTDLNNSCGVSDFSSTSKCPSEEPGVVDAMILCGNELYRRVTKDLKNIDSVADSIDTLDNVMANYGTKLNMQVKSDSVNITDLVSSDGKNLTSNEELRSRIQGIVQSKGGDLKLEDRTINTQSSPRRTSGGGNYGYVGESQTVSTPSSSSSTPSTNPSHTITPTTPAPITVTTRPTPINPSTPTTTSSTSTHTPSNKVKVDDVVPITGTLTGVQTMTSPEVTTNESTGHEALYKTSGSEYNSISNKLNPDLIDDKTNIIEENVEGENPIASVEVLNAELADAEKKVIAGAAEPFKKEVKTTNNSDLIAGIAAVGAAGAVIGAGAYAANKIMEKNEKDEEDEDDLFEEGDIA